MQKAVAALCLLLAVAASASAQEIQGDGEGSFNGVWRFSADYLQWRTSRSGLDYLVTDDATAFLFSGQVRDINPGSQPGFRVGIGLVLDDGWDFGGRYTNYTAANGAHFVDPDEQSFATRVNPDAFLLGDGDIAEATSIFSVDLEQIDAEMGFWSIRDEFTQVRLFGGGRLGSLDQRMNTTYIDSDNIPDTVFVGERLNMDFFGGQLGVDGHTRLWRGLTAFGNFRTAALLGNFRGSLREIEVGPDATRASLDYSYQQMVFNVEAAAGVGYIVFESGKSTIELQGGYELNSWFNMPDFFNATDELIEPHPGRNLSTLAFDGWFVRLTGTW